MDIKEPVECSMVCPGVLSPCTHGGPTWLAGLKHSAFIFPFLQAGTGGSSHYSGAAEGVRRRLHLCRCNWQHAPVVRHR